MYNEPKAALITGGARRIGKELAVHLAARGYDIAIHYFNSDTDAKQTAKEIEQYGRKSVILKADLNEPAEVQGLIEQTVAELPALCLLVNNASVWNGGSLKESSLEEFDQNFNVHVKAPYLLTRDYARQVRKGNIINILDSNIARNKADEFAYLLSKKCLHELTKMAAVELAPDIRVNALAPGMILKPENQPDKAPSNLVQRHGSPQDVLQAVDYLLDNQMLTGQCLYLAGGKDLVH